MPYLPPSDYKPFDKPPEGLKKYKNTKYIFVSSIAKTFTTKKDFIQVTSTKYVSLYEWWFQYRGKWYMHLNEYIGQKKGENFAYNGTNFAEPSEAWWIDSEGNKWPYIHPNQKKVIQ